MSKSSDPGHFFQTETAIATAARRLSKARNKLGNPIQVSSKILAILVDPLDSNRIYIAESGGLVRRVNLHTGDKTHIYKGHSSPATSLALNSSGSLLFSGGWDKTIICWNVETCEQTHRFIGHSDFVKSIIFIPCPPSSSTPGGILLSGSSDTCIIIWNAISGERLHVLRGHTRAVSTFAIDPVASTEKQVIVYTAGSEREIRTWRVPLLDVTESEEASESIIEHETSVHKLSFQGEDGDLWSASADNTARRIDVRSVGKKPGTRTDTLLQHSDYVNDVLVDRTGRYVITACRDENVRIWDIATGELYHTYDGHADEVTGLSIAGEAGDILVSVSIDCTIRRWSLKLNDLKSRVDAGTSVRKYEEKQGGLTEEEERELAELMESND
ncbi:WD40-repeat-containing domain protein [Geopyxis carbonaria]|nr:WD40-repeat-containing domain protein [Geopyxis carbonaria]